MQEEIQKANLPKRGRLGIPKGRRNGGKWSRLDHSGPNSWNKDNLPCSRKSRVAYAKLQIKGSE